MTVKASGSPLAITEVEAEFGGAAPTSLNEYYRNGSYVTNAPPWNQAIPTSGTIDLGTFYSKDKYYSGALEYNSPGTYSYTLPRYADTITVYCHGGGAGGGTAAYGEWNSAAGGGGGGGAGQIVSGTYYGVGGKTLYVNVGGGGAGGYWYRSSGGNGGQSFCNADGSRLITADCGYGGGYAPGGTWDNRDGQVNGAGGGGGYPGGAGTPGFYWWDTIYGPITGYDGSYGSPIYAFTSSAGDVYGCNGGSGGTPWSGHGSGGGGGRYWGGNASGYGGGGGGGGFDPGWRFSGHFSGPGAGWWGGGSGTGGFVRVYW